VFTGIVTAVGTVRATSREAGGLSLRIGAPFRSLRRGESVAVDGACLTVERLGKGWFTVHVIQTSLERTLFGEYTAGRRVNLERALRAGDALGGHLVQGHVDGIGRVEAAMRRDDAWLLDVSVPAEVARVSIPLGSIAIDGVSLTVNAVPAPGIIQVALIPVTFQQTTLGSKQPGDRVHVEGDVIGKYVEKAIGYRRSAIGDQPADIR
jgi:riboflavin synthase